MHSHGNYETHELLGSPVDLLLTALHEDIRTGIKSRLDRNLVRSAGYSPSSAHNDRVDAACQADYDPFQERKAISRVPTTPCLKVRVAALTKPNRSQSLITSEEPLIQSIRKGVPVARALISLIESPEATAEVKWGRRQPSPLRSPPSYESKSLSDSLTKIPITAPGVL